MQLTSRHSNSASAGSDLRSPGQDHVYAQGMITTDQR
jgi:hypothetical protein